MAHTCPNTPCAFSTNDSNGSAQHASDYTVGDLYGCQSYTCGTIFCTWQALEAHMKICPEFLSWNLIRRNGPTMNDTQTRTARLRAVEITSGTLGTGGTWNARKGGNDGAMKSGALANLSTTTTTADTTTALSIATPSGALTSAVPNRIIKHKAKVTATAAATRSIRGTKRKVEELELSDDVQPKVAPKFSTRQRPVNKGTLCITTSAFGEQAVPQDGGDDQGVANERAQQDDDEDTIRVSHPIRDAPASAFPSSSTLDGNLLTEIASLNDMFPTEFCCSFCTESFAVHSSAAHHVRISNTPPRYKCPGCPFTICTRQQLINHLEDCEDAELWRLNDGAFSYPDLNDIIQFEEMRLLGAPEGAQVPQQKVFMSNAQETSQEVQERKVQEAEALPKPEMAEVVSLTWSQAAKIRAMRGIK